MSGKSRLEELRELEKARTRGPWYGSGPHGIRTANGDLLTCIFPKNGWKDAAFISELANLAPLLLDLWEAASDINTHGSPCAAPFGRSCTCGLKELQVALTSLESPPQEAE